MATKAQKLRMAEQGYCSSNNAPACSNCEHINDGFYKDKCNLGDFPATSAGWCPSWNPLEVWKENNRRAYDLLQEREA